MKQILKLFGITVIIGILMYLMGSFIAASFDITDWDGFGRVMLAVIWVILSITVIGIAYEEHKKE